MQPCIRRAGAAEATARLVSSLVLHLEQRRAARIEQHELVAMCAVLSLVDRHMADRATREEALAEAVA